MSREESSLREQLCHWGRSLFQRGLTGGSSGNLSARLADGFLVTPTNACLGFLDPSRLSKLDPSGAFVSGDPPTKEIPLHLAFYEGRPGTGGVVHLHSTYATALSCLADLDPDDALPPITPYLVMRLGTVPMVQYTPPGSPEIGPLVASKASGHAALLLANHGPVVSGRTFEAAVFAAEELEESAKLLFLTSGRNRRMLSQEAVADLKGRKQP